MQCFSSKSGDVGPVVYCHNDGHEAPNIVKALAQRMVGRSGDLRYSSARLVQEVIDIYPHGNYGFVCWNKTTKLTAKDTHGDAGVVLIDVDNDHKCECMGGYLSVGPDGYPTHDHN